METKINTEELIKLYKDGASLNSLARMFNIYPMSVKRILEKNEVELRHDTYKKGVLHIDRGEELLKWAKSQGRLVSKTELAKVAGIKRLTPLYFTQYPELNQYIKVYGSKDEEDYSNQLYNWLKENNIPYKPNDKKTLGIVVTALLLDKYENIAIQINIDPSTNKKRYAEMMKNKLEKATEKGVIIIWLNEDDFKDLSVINNCLKTLGR